VEGWTLIRLAHELAMAFFVGGQLVLVATLVPAVRRRGDDGLMRDVARRFGIGSAVALAVLVATGAAMAGHFARWGDDALQLKLVLVVVVVALAGLHAVTPHTRALSIVVLAGSLVVTWLGVELAHG
jgi:peptidoglycan/LPS O-acetylase OafA/YrhL